MKGILFSAVLFLFLAVTAAADTIFLGTGEVVTGTIISESEEGLEINVRGINLTYYSEDIVKIERGEVGDQANQFPEEQDLNPMLYGTPQPPVEGIDVAMRTAIEEFKKHRVYGDLLGYQAAKEGNLDLCYQGENSETFAEICRLTFEEYVKDYYWAKRQCDKIDSLHTKQTCMAMKENDFSTMSPRDRQIIEALIKDDIEGVKQGLASGDEPESVDVLFMFIVMENKNFDKCIQYAQGLPHIRRFFCNLFLPDPNAFNDLIQDFAFLNSSLGTDSIALCPYIKDEVISKECFAPVVASIEEFVYQTPFEPINESGL